MRRSVSVWGTGQADVNELLAIRGYGTESTCDSSRTPPSIAAYAIAKYAPPAGLVLDPDCGCGTVLVEALQAGRDAVGATSSTRWWNVARANVSAAKRLGAPGHGMVVEVSAGMMDALTDSVDLIVAAVRTFATEPGVTAHLEGLLRWCRPTLRPDAFVVLTAPPRRHRDELLDLPGCMAIAGRLAGLRPVERAIAVTAEVRGSRLVPHASLPQRRYAERQSRRCGRGTSVPAHWDVAVFQAAARGPHQAAHPLRCHSVAGDQIRARTEARVLEEHAA